MIVDLFLTSNPRSFQNSTAISTGLSDFHKLVVTALKKIITKKKPKEISYRNYQFFNKLNFRENLRSNSEQGNCDSDYQKFEHIFMSTLEKHAPLKKKMLRANHAPYMTKALRKATMKRSSLNNKVYKNWTVENQNAYKKQKNYCSR